MTRFRPNCGMPINIASIECEFMPHPIYANQVFMLEGSEAFIFQLRSTEQKTSYALKAMKPSYRGEYVSRCAKELLSHYQMPGLHLGYRFCLTRESAPAIVAAYPDLEYAVVMPWLQATTWAGLMQDKSAGSTYLSERARKLALETVRVLQYLEKRHMAHTDIAGNNVFLSSDLTAIQLLDLDGMYFETAYLPQMRRRGSTGYQHRHLTNDGQWHHAGDRFAGAILLTEMLTWCDPLVRALTPENAESLFQVEELQTVDFPLWQAVRSSLFAIDIQILHLFDQAWASSHLMECPDFFTWRQCLERVCGTQNAR